MSTQKIQPERVIVLAAGEGFQLDGFNKLLLKHPTTGETVLEQYQRLFAGLPMTVVVGYRAVAVMQRFPQLDYVYNADWRVSSNSYSLSLALDERSTYVLSSDFFLDVAVIDALNAGPNNAVLAMNRENRTGSAIHLIVDEGRCIQSFYKGSLRSSEHPEAPGIFKICSAELLRQWKDSCMSNRSLFAMENLPLDGSGDTGVYAVDPAPHGLDEINTPMDYINLMERTRAMD